ncbi:NINE protein [Terriglobus albidus]|uniref:NINE protein n=1 Tax=Terriglobus albidus TaxID=1592106 RepID=A0A5B9E5A9_9BACT|nr:NINE protein [Terriglobus albidus]QEE26754.1 NINE protein [Terriglobus albidus]
MTGDPYTAGMTDAQRAYFYSEYQNQRKDEVAGILFAFFLGSFGAHHFYLKRNGMGILYACFFWSGIPGLIALVECFFMPGRVREYNALLALQIQQMILNGTPAPAPPPANNHNPYLANGRVCSQCGAQLEQGAQFCPKCGTRVA